MKYYVMVFISVMFLAIPAMADTPEMDSQIAKHFENLLNTMLTEEKEEALAHKNII